MTGQHAGHLLGLKSLRAGPCNNSSFSPVDKYEAQLNLADVKGAMLGAHKFLLLIIIFLPLQR